MASVQHRPASRLQILPRPPLDPSIRRQTYGRIVPLPEDQTWWERLFRR